MNQSVFFNGGFQIITSLVYHVSKVARITLQLALMVLFFWFFGLPAIEKYQERKVMVVESWRPTGGIVAPVVTIFPMNDEINGTYPGTYKNGGFEQICSNLKGNDTIENCIATNSNNKNDFLGNVLFGVKRKKTLMSEQNIKEEFSMPINGRYYSLDVPLQMHPNRYDDQITFFLSKHFTYYILIHDPNFFFGFYNPNYPMLRETAVNPNTTLNYYHYLIVTDVEELDLPEDPCNPDHDYNYQTCFKQSLSRQVGCRTSWDRWSRTDLTLCTDMGQFR